ncbi:MAG: hypothetical protein J0H74_04635 [Chitinophagaceae bacterium]|nr:hypothetical protein [Chitinophagaceae bacterium]
MKKLFGLAAMSCILITKNCPAQSYVPSDAYPSYFGINSVMPPTPTAAALGTFANYAVGNFRGTPNIDVPIYEINEGGFKLPISLSYNASGIKVADYSSWVGLSWSLNAGGVITRMIQDVADDWTSLRDQAPVASLVKSGGLYYNYNLSKSTIENYYATAGFVTPSSANFIDGYNDQCGQPAGAQSLWSLMDNHLDTEPDIFFYNFNGHTGKFIFNKGTDSNTNIGFIAADQHKISLIPYRDLKFNYSLNPIHGSYTTFNANGFINTFDVFDEQGNHYYFSNPEWSYSNINFHIWNDFRKIPVNGTQDAGYSYSSWYLTRIVTALGKTINFTYSSEQYTQDIDLEYTVRDFVNGGLGCSTPYNQPGQYENSFGFTTHYGQRLAAIEGDDFKILFNADLGRTDLIGSNALTAIQVYSKDINHVATLVKEFDLQYSYFQPAVMPTLSQNDLNYGNSNQRLRLDAIVEKGSDGSLKPPTSFIYNDNPSVPALPSRHSVQQDFFGYFNGNSCASLIPTVYVYTHLPGNDRLSVYPYAGLTPDFTIAGADRTVNPTAILSGTLKSITYPTGGVTSFTFEPNDFYYRNTTMLGGGLRLKQTTNYDGISHGNDVIKNYSYTKNLQGVNITTGVVIDPPVFAYTQNFANYWEPSYTNSNSVWYPVPYTYEWDPFTDLAYYTHNMVITSRASYSLDSYNGEKVGYTEIAESTPGNGKTVTDYSSPARYNDTNDSVGGACDININGYCDGLYKQTPVKTWIVNRYGQDGYGWIQPPDNINSIDVYGLNMGPNGFPFAPNLNYDWNRGLVTKKSIYDESGKLLNTVDYSYVTYSPGVSKPLYTYGLKKGIQDNYLLFFSNFSAIVFSLDLDKYLVSARYPIITNIAKVLSAKTTKSFDPNNSSSYMQTVETYNYASNEMLPVKIETTTSTGDTLDKFMFYPMDYNLPGFAQDPVYTGIKNLQTGHVINPVIETYTRRQSPSGANQRFINGKIVTYQANIMLPANEYQLEVANPPASYSSATISSTGITMDPNYRLNTAFDSYSINGNLLHQTQVGNQGASFIWGYNQSLPVAQVVNTSTDNSTFAYTSFEENDMYVYNWTIGNGVITGAKARTGNNYYNLSAGGVSSTMHIPGGNYVLSFWGDDANAAHYLVSVGQTVGSGSSSVKLIKQETPASAGALAYFEYQVNISYTSAVVSLSSALSTAVNIDELRLYPGKARMKTFTYNKMVGVTSVCDESDHVTTYEYDAFSRLILVRDQDKNILRKIDYQYQVPAGGAVQSSVIYSSNYVLQSGYVATFTNVATAQQQSFNIPSASNAQQALGSIPNGRYNITVKASGSTSTRIIGFTGNCNSSPLYLTLLGSSSPGSSVTFSNVDISSGNCNAIYIDRND